MTPAGGFVKLRVSWGDVPEPGDELRMRKTGHRYLVLTVRGKTLRCQVLAADEPTTGRVISWRWAPRRPLLGARPR